MQDFGQGKNCGIILEKIFYTFKHINPSTIMMERVFSICGFIKSKYGNIISPDLLDRIIFLSHCYNKTNNLISKQFYYYFNSSPFYSHIVLCLIIFI